MSGRHDGAADRTGRQRITVLGRSSFLDRHAEAVAAFSYLESEDAVSGRVVRLLAAVEGADAGTE
jgi:hypothetical protein